MNTDLKNILEKVIYYDSECDHESAHINEDLLYLLFIEMIANGELHDLNEIKSTAKEILQTQFLNFERWYA